MNPLLFLRGFAVLASAACLCSCASISVKEVAKSDASQPRTKPAHIYVEPFDVAKTKVKENRFRKNPGKLTSEAQQLLSGYLVEELTRTIAPATAVGPGKAPPQGGWLVSGEIIRLAEGSRLFRMGLGVGFGGTKMETKIAVRNLPSKNKPFLQFATTGGSNATPGAATNPIPFSAAPTALLASKEGVTDDSARTARMIAATIADYMVQRGWLDAAVTPKPKMAAKR